MPSLTDPHASAARTISATQRLGWYAACGATGVVAPHLLFIILLSSQGGLWSVPVIYGLPVLVAAMATPRCDELDRVWGALLTLGATLAVILGWTWLLAGID